MKFCDKLRNAITRKFSIKYYDLMFKIYFGDAFTGVSAKSLETAARLLHAFKIGKYPGQTYFERIEL
jgi:hypothetical protein